MDYLTNESFVMTAGVIIGAIGGSILVWIMLKK